jgi:preprotein translocase subunit Sec63
VPSSSCEHAIKNQTDHTEDKTLKDKAELSSLCTIKYKNLEKRAAKGKGFQFPIWSVMFWGAWILLAWTCYGISQHEQEAVYDPYEILGISEDGTERDAKKAGDHCFLF